MAHVELQAITKRFRNVTALRDVNLEINDGEFFVLLGPTGAGKTTTLRVIAGLEKQEGGSVLFDGENMNARSPAERDVAFVFQQYSLYPTMSVYDNLAFPLRSPMRRVPEGEVQKRVREVAETLRIAHLLERKTAHLSGGEMQRVSIGRAIVRQPRIFLMDEPLSNLDAKLREALRIELQHLQKRQASTVLFVTHDQVEALTLADRIGVLRQGRVVQIGAPQDIYDRPASVFVAQLVGTPRINLLPATQRAGNILINDSAIDITLNGASPADGLTDLPETFTLGVRPEDVQITPTGAHTGEVNLVEPLGVETIIHIRSGQQTLLSVTAGMAAWRVGDTVRFDVARPHLHFFDADGQRLPVEIKR
jgi:multiple sugar transport system ATP-binding protein